MSKEVKVRYVGKIEILVDGSIVKTYFQTVSGSAWKKVGTDVILLYSEGYSNIILKVNDTHPNKGDMLFVARQIQKYFPGVKVEEVVGI